MKALLATQRGLNVLFSGGCALLLVTGAGYNEVVRSLPLAFVPGGLAVLDVLVMLSVLGLLFSQGGPDSEDLFAGAFAIKAGLTPLHARKD